MRTESLLPETSEVDDLMNKVKEILGNNTRKSTDKRPFSNGGSFFFELNRSDFPTVVSSFLPGFGIHAPYYLFLLS
jgi:hypothetical protein